MNKADIKRRVIRRAKTELIVRPCLECGDPVQSSTPGAWVHQKKPSTPHSAKVRP